MESETEGVALAILQPNNEAGVTRCREREQVLQELELAKEAVCTIVVDLFRDHLQDQAVNTDVADAPDYEALLDEERRIRVSVEDELREQLMAIETELHQKEARFRELQMERDELAEQVAEHTRLLESERGLLTSQLQSVQAEQEKLHGQVKEDAGVQRSLIKELSLLLHERDSLLREVSRSGSGSPTNDRRLQLIDQSPHKRECASTTATTIKLSTLRQAWRDCVNELPADTKGTLSDLSQDQTMPPEKLSGLSGSTTYSGQSEVARESTQATLSSMRAKFGRLETAQVQHGCRAHDNVPCRNRRGSKVQELTQSQQHAQVGFGRIARPIPRSASDSSRFRGSPSPSCLKQSSELWQTSKGQGSRYPRRRLLEKQNAPTKDAKPLKPGTGPAPVAPPASALSLLRAGPQKKIAATSKPKTEISRAGFTEVPKSTERAYRRHLQGLLRRIRPEAH
eukprot:TRINITY_DN27475_c0_g1_i1.p1 TRINITY_DN27475_c0_g1~~TRINITY_DN27475_c0_g1_i1.p1  ORF type:complete len:455 (-),score=45.58 TRINITY_DN27475_c0_g1_i1:294-1658(-)